MIYIEEKATKKVPGLTSLFINFSYKKEIVDALKTIKCYDYDKKEKIWEVPLSYCSELLDKLCLYDDIELKLLKDKVEKDGLYKLSNYKTKPYNYQIEGIQFGLNHNKWLLLDEMGLGKSLQAIYIAQELKKRDKIKHCLIICGVNNLKANWKKEILTHTNLSCMILGEKINSKGRSVMGSIKERAAQLSKPIKEFFVITNIETLRETCIMDAFKLKKNEFDLIIVDEIHSCFPYNTLIQTTNGLQKIGDIVENKINTKINSFNHKNNIIESKSILNYYKIPNNKSLIEFEIIDEFGKVHVLRCTSEHKVYTKNRGYIKAKDLTSNDILEINIS